jgi:hypothetical protein
MKRDTVTVIVNTLHDVPTVQDTFYADGWESGEVTHNADGTHTIEFYHPSKWRLKAGAGVIYLKALLASSPATFLSVNRVHVKRLMEALQAALAGEDDDDAK